MTNTNTTMTTTTALNHLIAHLPPAPHLRLLAVTGKARALLSAFGAFDPASAGYFKLLKWEMETAGFGAQCPFMVLTAGHCPQHIVEALRVRFA